MKCLRCNYEWDVREGPCPRCRMRTLVSMSPEVTNPLLEESPLGKGRVSSLSDSGTVHISAVQQVEFPSEQPTQLQFPISGPIDMQHFPPGTLLHQDRYRLQKVLYKQEWPLGIVETIWAAFDTYLATAVVIIHELYVPDGAPEEAQAIPHTAKKIFTSIGHNPHILFLRNVLSDKGHSFFIFEPGAGFSLAALISNNKGKLPEQEVIACCLQIVNLLEICSQQSLPLIHGNIRPENILRKSASSHYMLTNFSVALAGGLAHIVVDTKNAALSPYSTVDAMRSKLNGRSDLSMLLQVAYYAVTGKLLSAHSAIMTSSDLSPQFRTILSKGLFAPFQQRYQRPSELYQDLLTIRQYEGLPALDPALVGTSRQFSAPMAQIAPQERKSEPLSQLSQPLEEYPEYVLLVPRPEELPPLKHANDMFYASLWFVGMCLGFVLLLGRGLL